MFPVRDLRQYDSIDDLTLSLPSKPVANYLLSVFFQHCSDTLYFVHQLTMLVHVEGLYLIPDQAVKLATDKDRWVLARFLTMLAVASLHSAGGTPSHNPVDQIPGLRYFLQARKLIPSVVDCRGVDAVQVLALLVSHSP